MSDALTEACRRSPHCSALTTARSPTREGGGRVPASLVVPKGRGPSAGVLFGHWMLPGSRASLI
ncbi:MAG: hypothetical protein M3444_20515 [Acidobacteriota bacterium]|nr:hypothetical protein [Acidobacteriota bacterium]MDQ5837963.1 hypothetical protein [Acidobacteriota bacterium]